MLLSLYIPLKIITKDIKYIIGPIRKIEKHYYLALAFVAPDPNAVRWELHVITDPENHINTQQGIVSIFGYKQLIKYKGEVKQLAKEAVRLGLKGRLYIPKWGIPLIKAEKTNNIEKEYITVMTLYGLKAAQKLLGKLASETSIIEI